MCINENKVNESVQELMLYLLQANPEVIKKIYDTEIAILQNLYYDKKTKIIILTGTVEERKKTVENVLDNLK